MTTFEKGNGIPLPTLRHLEKSINEKEFDLNYGFLMCHNGLQRKKLHLLLAPMSSGKSNLTKSILQQLLNQKHRVVVFLSEETIFDFSKRFNFNPENVFFIEEDKENFSDYKEAFAKLNVIIGSFKPDVLIIDNITTSIMLDESISIKEKENSVRQLKRLLQIKNIAGFAVAHTKKEVTQNFHRMIVSEDVRGYAKIAIKAEFLYCMNTFFVGNTRNVIVTVEKHRGEDIDHKNFCLVYDNGKYTTDYAIDFEKIKSIFKGRNKL